MRALARQAAAEAFAAAVISGQDSPMPQSRKTPIPPAPFEAGPRAAPVLPPAPLLPAAEVAGRLGVSLRHVRRLIADGRLPVHRLGRAVRISEPDLLRFLRSCRM